MTLCTNGKIAFYSFLLSNSLLLLSIFAFVNNTFTTSIRQVWIYVSIVFFLLTQTFVAIVYRRREYVYKIAWRASLLGNGFAFGALVTLFATESWRVFGLYLSVLCFFHFSEYFTISVVNPKTLSLDSFILNHSREYAFAAIFSWFEFIVERHFYPNFKQIWWLSVVGFILCVCGEVIRKLAMITAGSNFNHVVQSYREDGHVLVTNGIYGLCRHPAYVGWLYWSIGTQIILLNPICTVGYAMASWLFFKNRIRNEEVSLLNFFGEDYVSYQRRVKTGIPFVAGYRIEF